MSIYAQVMSTLTHEKGVRKNGAEYKEGRGRICRPATIWASSWEWQNKALDEMNDVRPCLIRSENDGML